MSVFDNVIKLTDDSKVELAASFKELLHKELCLGMTRYTCRYGTLGDGHEMLTDAQKYYQSIKEMWVRASGMNELKAQAMEAQAELIEAETAKEVTDHPAQRLRLEAKILRATQALTNALVNAEDTLRQMDEFNKVRLELQDKVRAQYPEGIEQAEPDHWKAIANYRRMKEQTPGLPREVMSNIPMPADEKARLGVKFQRQDMVAPLIISDERKANEIARLNHGKDLLA